MVISLEGLNNVYNTLTLHYTLKVLHCQTQSVISNTVLSRNSARSARKWF
jgi:hypothetical protein